MKIKERIIKNLIIELDGDEVTKLNNLLSIAHGYSNLNADDLDFCEKMMDYIYDLCDIKLKGGDK